MQIDDFLLRQTVVFASALIYWAGVMVQARRVRKRIGRQPNVSPRGTREKLLWLGWMLVVVTWMALAFLVNPESSHILLQPLNALVGPLSLTVGITLVVLGYACTHWCYISMGNTWRMGIDHVEKTELITRGPYGMIRHPIYIFQTVMLIGVAALLPAPLAFIIIPVHLICVWIKTGDEEAHLVESHGQAYLDYRASTGRLLPRLLGKPNKPI